MNPIVEDLKTGIRIALETADTSEMKRVENRWNFYNQKEMIKDILEFIFTVKFLEILIRLDLFSFYDDHCKHEKESVYQASIIITSSSLEQGVITFHLFNDNGKYTLKRCKECKAPLFRTILDKERLEFSNYSMLVYLDDDGVKYEYIDDEE